MGMRGSGAFACAGPCIPPQSVTGFRWGAAPGDDTGAGDGRREHRPPPALAPRPSPRKDPVTLTIAPPVESSRRPVPPAWCQVTEPVAPGVVMHSSPFIDVPWLGRIWLRRVDRRRSGAVGWREGPVRLVVQDQAGMSVREALGLAGALRETVDQLGGALLEIADGLEGLAAIAGRSD